MIQLTINSEKFEYTPGTLQDLPQFLDDISNKYLSEGKTIIAVKFNDQILELSKKELPSELLKNLKQIELEVVTNEELAIEMLKACGEHIVMTNEMASITAGHYRKNQLGEAEAHFFRLIDAMEILSRSIEYVQQILWPKIKDKKDARDMLESGERRLLALLRDILKAKEKKDIVLLADLLEYELATTFNHWKALIVPQLLAL